MTFALAAVLVLVELAGPVYAETRTVGTPWHPHHIAERYGLMVIIALGEGMIGTMASMTAIVGPDGPGWSVDFVLVGLAGVALVFGMWWTYFTVPCGALLAAHRERSFGWGYGHIILFGAVVAVGAGLHVAAYYLEHHTELDVARHPAQRGRALRGLRAVGLPAVRRPDPDASTRCTSCSSRSPRPCVALSVVLAVAGVSLAVCLLVLALGPWVTVVGYELRGHRHNEEVLAAL